MRRCASRTTSATSRSVGASVASGASSFSAASASLEGLSGQESPASCPSHQHDLVVIVLDVLGLAVSGVMTFQPGGPFLRWVLILVLVEEARAMLSLLPLRWSTCAFSLSASFDLALRLVLRVLLVLVVLPVSFWAA